MVNVNHALLEQKVCKEDMQNIEQIHEKVKALLASVNTLLASTDEKKVKEKK